MLCVVENPADVQAIEQAGAYRGFYFVTMGNLSPIDGIGPEELGMDALSTRAADGVSEVNDQPGKKIDERPDLPRRR